jgi:hypothetical protein
MRDAGSERRDEKEREVSEKRVSRWPIIPLIGGPVGILILLCYVASAKPPAPVAPDETSGVIEENLLKEAEEIKSEAQRLYYAAFNEEDQKKKNEVCDQALALCDKALDKYDKIRIAYEKRGLMDKANWVWEQANVELNTLRKDISSIRGF